MRLAALERLPTILRWKLAALSVATVAIGLPGLWLLVRIAAERRTRSNVIRVPAVQALADFIVGMDISMMRVHENGYGFE